LCQLGKRLPFLELLIKENAYQLLYLRFDSFRIFKQIVQRFGLYLYGCR
jgi:hypothetical protein